MEIPKPDGVCEPSTKRCEGKVLRTCGDDNQWNAELDRTCELACGGDHCVRPSLLPLDEARKCTASARALTIEAGQTWTLDPSGTKLQCTGCGVTTAAIDAAGVVAASAAGLPKLRWFCLSSLEVRQEGVLSLAAAPALPPVAAENDALALVVAGDVTISGRISARGETAAAARGRGGPGGYDGATADNQATPNDGDGGVCGGRGGAKTGGSGVSAGGGGGGGGHRRDGANGGVGRVNSTMTAAGGAKGVACRSDDFSMFGGGGGGGAGADGAEGTDGGNGCLLHGGGGGGALLVFAAGKLEVANGHIDASGGDGGSAPTGNTCGDGGGGGGAGGAILLEAAAALTVTGKILVHGGAGGKSKSANGGAGAADQAPTEGANAANDATLTGGGGGGGGSGRIRLHSATPAATCPSTVSPLAACTTGLLTAVP